MGGEDFEQFLDIRRHVKRLTEGTPLLLRTSSDAGQEELMICTFRVSPDLKHMCWEEQEGGSTRREVPISNVVEVSADKDNTMAEATPEGEDGHFGLNVRICGGGATWTMGLICACPEDLTSWREGLKFLAGPKVAEGDAKADGAGKNGTASAGNTGNAKVPAGSSGTAKPQASTKTNVEENGLHQKLRQQEDIIAKLRQENDLLRETVKRKDTTIAELLRDVQNRSVERCNKTESTSRESDDHLRDREVAILQQRNRRLTKELKAKQQTVDELLRTVSRLNATHESSAVEDEEVVGSDASDEESVQLGRCSDVGKMPNRDTDAGGAPAREEVATKRRPVFADLVDDHEDEGDAGDVEADEEFQALANKLARLESAVAGLNFSPPDRPLRGGGGGKSAPPSCDAASGTRPTTRAGPSTAPSAPDTSSSQTQAASSTAPSLMQSPNARALGAIQALREGGAAGIVPASGISSRSIAALEVLAAEMAKLEEKKRVVEQLAKGLEPPSEDEEDDGFPLR